VLVPFAALAANLGLIGGDVGNVAIYGDSMSNEGNPGTCEWCDPLSDAGINVWVMAQGGARTYDDDTVDPNACQSATYQGCQFYGERMVSYLDGSCRRDYGAAVYPGDTTQTTCVTDLPLSAQTVDVFFFGANDVGNVNLSSWGVIYRARSLAAWEVMLDASDAAGHANVIVLGPPYIRNDLGHDESDDVLVDLHDALRTECASRPRCEIADTYSAFRAVEAAYGSAEMYEMYEVGDDCPATSCVHPADGPTTNGIRPRELVGGVILNAIRRANDKRIAGNSPAPASNTWDSGVWDTAEWGA